MNKLKAFLFLADLFLTQHKINPAEIHLNEPFSADPRLLGALHKTLSPAGGRGGY